MNDLANAEKIQNNSQALAEQFQGFSMLENSLLEKEQLKLALIKKIFQDNHIKHFSDSIKNDNDSSLQYGLYYGLIGFGFFEQCAGSFVFGFSLISLIPGIPKFSILLISAIYTLLDSVLFYAFEVSFLKEALGIVSIKSDLNILIELYYEQLTHVKQLNIYIQALQHCDICPPETLELLRILNNDLLHKSQNLQFKEISLTRNIIKYSILAFGICSTVAESYFFAHTFLLLLSSSLPFSGLGYLIIIVTILANLGFFYAMGASSLVKFIHPELDSLNELKTELHHFSESISQNTFQPSLL